jgi:hypothetical protein
MSKLSLQKITVVALLFFFSTIATAQQWGNYTLYSVSNSTNAYLIDTASAIFHTWTFPSNARTGYSSYLLPGGDLIRTVSRSGNSFNGGGMTGQLQKYDFAGNLTWDFVYSTSTYCMHHDICPLPNGNVLLIAYESKTAAEATAAGSSQAITIWSEKIVEVQQTGPTTGTVVWEWHLWDHLVQDHDPTKANYQASIVDHPELLNINYATQRDWIHMNGIDYNPMLEQIVVSSHNLDQWFVIDHSTTTAEAASHSGGNSGKGGDFLYRYGNPDSYGASGSTVLNVTHDSHWIPENCPNAGSIVGFNNRGISSTQSAVDRIVPPVNGYNYDITPGQAYLPLIYDERHACNGYSSNMGNSQHLPNGNMLVCMATSGLIYEVDPAGNLLWSKTATGSVAQAFRYDECYVNNAAPAIPAISQVVDTLISTPAVSYQWYFNGVQFPGATEQTFLPTQEGRYVVRITDANGCVYQYSPGFDFVFSSTSISQNNLASKVSLYPNPTTGIIHIDNSAFGGKSYKSFLYDQFGKLIYSSMNNSELDLNSYENGVYFVTLVSETGTVSKKISLIR